MSAITLPEVEQLAGQLSVEDQLTLLEWLAELLRRELPDKQPQDLYGAFKDQFPEDFDVDAALQEIKTAWKGDLDQMTGPAAGDL